MAIELELLKNIHYFSGLSPDELESIKKFISEKTVRKGQIFVIEGDWSDFIYFIISGLVKVYKTSVDSKEQILHIASRGESINDISAFAGTPNIASMLAMTPVVIYQIRKSDVKAILCEYPQIALNVTKVLADKVHRDSSLVEDLSFTQVTGRLAKMLLKHAGEEKENGLRLTQHDMAAIVGTTREVVNRSLKIMADMGAIRLEHRGIVSIDKEALEKMVKASS